VGDARSGAYLRIRSRRVIISERYLSSCDSRFTTSPFFLMDLSVIFMPRHVELSGDVFRLSKSSMSFCDTCWHFVASSFKANSCADVPSGCRPSELTTSWKSFMTMAILLLCTRLPDLTTSRVPVTILRPKSTKVKIFEAKQMAVIGSIVSRSLQRRISQRALHYRIL
jgi:hypothetical protein